MDLEISELTHETKSLIVVGTAIMKGEDQPSNGAVYVYDIIPVVPDPERPGTDRALKLVSREEVKGAVTDVSEIGDEGLMLAAQGQKLMVRGLKEDNTLLPVAFMDVEVQVTALKSVRGTGIALMADALKGVWLLGYAVSWRTSKLSEAYAYSYQPDPYRMKLFSRSRTAMQVVTAELLPYGKQLFAMVADTDCNIHTLEYNPEGVSKLCCVLSRLLTMI